MTEQAGVEEARKQLMARITEITDYPHGEIFAWEIGLFEAAVRTETLAEQRLASLQVNEALFEGAHEALAEYERGELPTPRGDLYHAPDWKARAEAAEARAAELQRARLDQANRAEIAEAGRARLARELDACVMDMEARQDIIADLLVDARAALAAEGESDA